MLRCVTNMIRLVRSTSHTCLSSILTVEPLAILEIEVAAVADLENSCSFVDVFCHLILIIEVDFNSFAFNDNRLLWK